MTYSHQAGIMATEDQIMPNYYLSICLLEERLNLFVLFWFWFWFSERETHYVTQSGLKLNPPASNSQVLGFQASATIPSLKLNLFTKTASWRREWGRNESSGQVDRKGTKLCLG
jgi:hypothetical protein